MAIYRFSFDSKYAGHTATVTDRSGNAVTGSPITLDADGDGTLNLTSGTYRAQVSNAEGAFGDGYSVVDGVLDLEASIDHAGGVNGTAAWFKVTAGSATRAMPAAWSKLSFSAMEDGWRQPLRPDIATVDDADDTSILIQQDGLYEIIWFLQAQVSPVPTDAVIYALSAISLNDEAESPAINFYPASKTYFKTSSEQPHLNSSYISVKQPCIAGDVLAVKFSASGATGNVSVYHSGASLAVYRLGSA